MFRRLISLPCNLTRRLSCEVKRPPKLGGLKRKAVGGPFVRDDTCVRWAVNTSLAVERVAGAAITLPGAVSVVKRSAPLEGYGLSVGIHQPLISSKYQLKSACDRRQELRHQWLETKAHVCTKKTVELVHWEVGFLCRCFSDQGLPRRRGQVHLALGRFPPGGYVDDTVRDSKCDGTFNGVALRRSRSWQPMLVKDNRDLPAGLHLTMQ